MERITTRRAMSLFSVVSFIPFLFLAVHSYISLTAEVKRDLITSITRFNENTSISYIERPVSEIINIFHYILTYTSENSINEHLENKSKELNSIISAIVNATPYFKSVTISDANENIKSYPPAKKVSEAISYHPWVNYNTLKNSVHFSAPYSDGYGDENKSIAAGMNLFNRYSERTGSIAFELDFRAISEILKNVNAPYNGRFNVVAMDGSVIINQNPHSIFERKVPLDWIKKATEPSGYFFDKKEKQYVFYKTFSNPDWVAFTVVDESEFKTANQEQYKTYHVIFTTYCFFYAVIMILLRVFFNRLISSLHMKINGIDCNALSEKENNIYSIYSKIDEKNKKLNNAVTESETDGLTGLNNRKKFEKDLELLIRNKSDFILVIIDIDNFKRINDTYGHTIGDHVLKYLGASVKFIRGDIDNDIYRIGGEEFVVILRGENKHTKYEIINNWRHEVSEKKWAEKGLYVTFSAGLTKRRTEDDSESILKRADNRLYLAKASGKNKVVIAD